MILQCPYCRKQHAVNPVRAKSDAAKLLATHGGCPPKLRPCKHCGEMYGARAMREHVGKCPCNPNLGKMKRAGRPRKINQRIPLTAIR